MKTTLLKSFAITAILTAASLAQAAPMSDHVVKYGEFIKTECIANIKESRFEAPVSLIAGAKGVKVKGEDNSAFIKDLTNYVIDATDCGNPSGAAKMALSSNMLNMSYPESMKALKAL